MGPFSRDYGTLCDSLYLAMLWLLSHIRDVIFCCLTTMFYPRSIPYIECMHACIMCA